jgi:hypothetical protein
MGWMSFRVADHIEAFKVSGTLQEAFFALLAAAGAPKDAAIFSRLNLEDGSTDFFFSPKAVEIASALAMKFNATACEPPKRDHRHTGLLIGDQRALELLPQQRTGS